MPYYNYDKIYSLNAQYNFIISNRGLGKTYGISRKVVQKAIDTGEQFVLLRRWKTELTTKDSFFDALIAKGEFPTWDFRVRGLYGEMSPKSAANDKKRAWQRIGYFIALSQGQHFKGKPFPLVKTIIFDEFIVENGSMQYIKGEVDAFNNFYSTIDRQTDKTKVFFLANSISIINPYFLHYKIQPQGEEWIKAQKSKITNLPFWVVHFPKAEDFKQRVHETRFGEFIEGTDYDKYATENQFADNHTAMLGEKPSHMEYNFTLETNEGIVTVWSWGGKYFVQEKRPKHEKIFTNNPYSMDETKYLIENNSKFMQILRTAYRNNRMKFDKQVTRNIFIQIFIRN